MNQREKILAAVVGLLVAAWIASAWYGDYRDTLSARRTAVDQAKARLAELNLALAQGRNALRQLDAWQERSLPSNREQALSLYKAWLLSKAKDAGLEVRDIKPSGRTTATAAYATIGYQIEASGSLAAVAAMLYEFYRSAQLQQITRLQLTRPAGESQIRASLEVEAISLPGALATDSLPQGDLKRLKLASLEEYQQSLNERDLVSTYTPPQPTAEANANSGAKTAESEAARFSATVPGGKGLQAWINFPATGEMLYLSAGDSLKVGTLESTIVSIEPRALVLQTGEKRFRVALGQSLQSGKEIDAEGAASNDAPISERDSSPPG